MRMSDTGRACLPKIRPSCFRYWSLEDVSPGLTWDAARGQFAGLVGTSVQVVQSPTGRAVAFSGALAGGLSEPLADAESRTLMEGDWTMHLLVRLTAEPTGLDAALAFVGNATDVPVDPNNNLGTAHILSDRRPSMVWEHSAGVDVQVSAATYDVPLYKPTLITWRKSGSTGPGDLGGTAVIELLINGHRIPIALGAGTAGFDSLTVTNSSHGSLARWALGQIPNAVGAPSLFLNGHLIAAAVYAEPLADSEIWDDVRRLYQLPFFARTDLRFDLETQTAGVMQDMTNLGGVDWVDRAEVSAEVDQPCNTGSVSLFREVGELTLARLRTDSKLNLTDPFNPLSYLPRIMEGRACELFAARVPLGLTASGEDWVSVLKGHVDEVDEGGAESVALTLRDQGGLLVDTYIEETVRYGNIPPVAVEGEMQFILNDNDSSAANNSVPNVNNPGITALVLRNGSYPPTTLYTPATPNWAITLFAQRREGVLAGLRTLAAQLAWEVRYRFDENPDQKAWRLTFYDPDRLREDVDCVFLMDDVLDLPRFARSILGVRNVVRVIYPSSETVTPAIPGPLTALITAAGFFVRTGWNNVDGEGGRVSAYVEIESPGSILAIRRRLFMELGEASSSQVDTLGEAATMAFGALLDLQESPLEKGVKIPIMFEVELNDMQKFGPDILTTVSQRLAVRSVTHSFDAQATTTLQLRGKPSVGFKRWLRLETRQGNARPGVQFPRDANADQQEGQLLQVMRNLLDRSAAFKGGKFLQVRNREFQGFANGLRNPPDGWAVRAGVWGTDIRAESATQLSGGKAVQFLTALGKLESDPIQIEGSRFIPYSFEARWLRTVATLNVNNATLSGAVGATVVLTVGVATFTAASVGTYVAITVAADAANVGQWLITTFTSTTIVILTKEAGFSGAGPFVNGANNFSWTACCVLRMDVEFLDVSKTVIATRTLTPEVKNIPSFGLESLDAVSGVWFSARADGVAPADNGNARFARMVLRAVGGPSTFQPIIVDTVSAYKTGLDLRTFPTSLITPTFSFAGWYPCQSPNVPYPSAGGLEVVRWDWGVTSFSTNIVGAVSFGNAIAGDVVLPAWSGYGFYAREDGTYSVTATVAVTSSTAARRWSNLRLAINATYTAGAPLIGIRTAGTVILQGTEVDLQPVAELGNAQFTETLGAIMTISGRVRLKRGDRLTVEFYRDVSIVVQKGTLVATGEISLFTVKQELTE